MDGRSPLPTCSCLRSRDGSSCRCQLLQQLDEAYQHSPSRPAHSKRLKPTIEDLFEGEQYKNEWGTDIYSSDDEALSEWYDDPPWR